MAKPALGRPPRAGEAATETIKLRATRGERRAWERAAEARDMTLSEWIRERCETRASRITVERDTDGAIVWFAYAEGGRSLGCGDIELGPRLEKRALRAAGEMGVAFDEDAVVFEDLT